MNVVIASDLVYVNRGAGQVALPESYRPSPQTLQRHVESLEVVHRHIPVRSMSGKHERPRTKLGCAEFGCIRARRKVRA